MLLQMSVFRREVIMGVLRSVSGILGVNNVCRGFLRYMTFVALLLLESSDCPSF